MRWGKQCIVMVNKKHEKRLIIWSKILSGTEMKESESQNPWQGCCPDTGVEESMIRIVWYIRLMTQRFIYWLADIIIIMNTHATPSAKKQSFPLGFIGRSDIFPVIVYLYIWKLWIPIFRTALFTNPYTILIIFIVRQIEMTMLITLFFKTIAIAIQINTSA